MQIKRGKRLHITARRVSFSCLAKKKKSMPSVKGCWSDAGTTRRGESYVCHAVVNMSVELYASWRGVSFIRPRKKGRKRRVNSRMRITRQIQKVVPMWQTPYWIGEYYRSKADGLIRGVRLDLLETLVESAGNRSSASRGADLIVATGARSRSRGCVCWGELRGSVQVFSCGANSRA